MRAAIFVVLLLSCCPAVATPVVDLSNGYDPPIGSGQSPKLLAPLYQPALVQTFTPTRSGALTQIDLLLADDPVPPDPFGSGTQVPHGSSAMVGIWSLDGGTLVDELAVTTIGWSEFQAWDASTSSVVWTDGPFRSPAAVSAGKTYALTITPVGNLQGLFVFYNNAEGGFHSSYEQGAAGLAGPNLNGAAINFAGPLGDLPVGLSLDLSFQVWIDPNPHPPVAGDLNGDGFVDLSDFGILKDNFGKPGPSSVNEPVPEPSTFLLASLAAAGCLAMTGRRQTRRSAG